MKFKGNIIITDPCYIIPDSNVKQPQYQDFGISLELYNKPTTNYTPEEQKLIQEYSKAMDEYWKEYNQKDIWRNGSIDLDSGYGLQKLGFTNFLWGSTDYGDWSCTTVKDGPETQNLIAKMNEHYLDFFQKYNFTGLTDKEKAEHLKQYEKEREEYKSDDLILGYFCADAGLVGVFLLDEVLKLNPKFDYHINRPWTTTLIKDFDGDIELTHRTTKVPAYDPITYQEIGTLTDESEVSVIGKGNINFYTTQTGL